MPTYRSPEMLSGAISDLRRRITAGSGDRAAAVHLLELVAIVAEMLASKDDRARLVDTITERDGQIAALRHECDGRLLQLAAVGHVLDVTPPLFPEVRDSQRWTDFATKLPPAAQELKGRCERLADERDELRAEVASLKDRPTLTAERLAEAMRDQGFLFNDHLAAAKRLLVRLGPVTLPAAPSGEVSDDGPLAVHRRDEAKLRAVRERLAKAPTMEVKADVTDPPLVDVARRALECAESWDPQARVLGNVRAADIARLCRAFMADGPPPPLTDHQVAAVVQRAEPVIAAPTEGCPVCGSTARIADGDSWCIECERAFTAEIDGTGRCSHQGVALWAVARSHARSPAREDVALTVGAALAARPYIEFHDGVVWRQLETRNEGRVWHRGDWHPAYYAGAGELHAHRPARLVPLADADAPPESRGPIGGAS